MTSAHSRRATALLFCCVALALVSCNKPGWRPDHTVIVILENRSAQQVEGNPKAPFLNTLAKSGASMTRAYFAQIPYGIVPRGASVPLPARPSQPNYLMLFSGDDQGVLPSRFQDENSLYTGTATADRDGNALERPLRGARVGIGNDTIPVTVRPFATPNLGAAIVAADGTFASFCESLPYPHYDGAHDVGGDASDPDHYRRKHNPAVNWIEMIGTAHPRGKARFLLPVSANVGFVNTHDPVDGKDYRGFGVGADGHPIGYDALPTVSIVVPDEQDDAHSNSLAVADEWLKANIGPYANWATTHNSLLVVTFDEDGSTDRSHGDPDDTGQDTIFTVFYGPPDRVIPGRYQERIDHLNVLATVLDRYGALFRYRFEFLATFAWTAQGRAEFANLRPVKDIFGEGPPPGQP